MGKRIGINVDQRLPTRQPKYTDGTLVPDYFVTYGTDRSKNGAWWVPLMEKAFSKFNQNYDRIQGGSGFESLRTLLNKPTYRLVHPDWRDEAQSNDFWKTLHSLHSRDYPSTIGCCREQPPDNWAINHAYTLLGTHEVTDSSGKTIRLLKIRNPWSREGYDGPWSDKSSLWTDSLKQQVGGVTESNDGIFFMEFEYALRYGDVSTVAVDLDFAQTQTWSIHQT